MGYSPWGHKESHTTQRLTLSTQRLTLSLSICTRQRVSPGVLFRGCSATEPIPPTAVTVPHTATLAVWMLQRGPLCLGEILSLGQVRSAGRGD